jgi:hypothetical protein
VDTRPTTWRAFWVCQALAAFGANVSAEKYYEYDVYCLDLTTKEPTGNKENDEDASAASTAASVTCELQNGQVGYWNENGELVQYWK